MVIIEWMLGDGGFVGNGWSGKPPGIEVKGSGSGGRGHLKDSD